MLYSSFSKNTSLLDQVRQQGIHKSPWNRPQEKQYESQQQIFIRTHYVQQGRSSQSRLSSHHTPESPKMSEHVYKLSNVSALKGSRKALPNFFNDVVNLRASLEPDRKHNPRNDHIIYFGPQKPVNGSGTMQGLNKSQRNLITPNTSHHYSTHQERIKRSLSGNKHSQSPPGNGSQARLSSIESVKQRVQNKGPTAPKFQYFTDQIGRVSEQRTAKLYNSDVGNPNNITDSGYRIRKTSKIEKPSQTMQTFEDQSAHLYDITPKFSLIKKETPREVKELSDTPTTKAKYSPMNFTKSSHSLMHMGSLESNETVKYSHPVKQTVLDQQNSQQNLNTIKLTLNTQPSIISKQFDELSIFEQSSNISNIDPIPKALKQQNQQNSPSPVESNMNESQQLGLEEFHNKYGEEMRDLNASLPQITLSDPKAPLKYSKSYNNPKTRNEESSENNFSSDLQNSQQEIHSADKPQKKGILKVKDVSQNYIQLIKRENPQFKAYIKQYEDAFESINQIGQCVVLSMEYLKAKNNFWIIPLFLTFKRLAQIRTEAEFNLMQKSNIFDLDDWEEFSGTKDFSDLCKKIRSENDIIEQEMGKLKQIAQRMSNKLEKARKIKVEWFLNEELNQNIKDTSFIYLYSQLLFSVRQQIKNPKSDNQVVKADWQKLALMMQFCLIVFESPLMKYELLDLDHFKKVTQEQNPDEMEEQIGIYDEILNEMKVRLVQAGYKL